MQFGERETVLRRAHVPRPTPPPPVISTFHPASVAPETHARGLKSDYAFAAQIDYTIFHHLLFSITAAEAAADFGTQHYYIIIYADRHVLFNYYYTRHTIYIIRPDRRNDIIRVRLRYLYVHESSNRYNMLYLAASHIFARGGTG